jgi:hypothetical protein
MAPLDDELQALYAVRPEDFVQARTELVRRLRKDGRRDDADVAAKLRRPSATAAALNQVAREEPHLLETLFSEGARLRDAMQRAVQGNAVDVRSSQVAERRAADAVVGAARRRLEQLGQRDSDAAAQRINNTLRAAALDDSLAQRLRLGLLDTDVVASGFGFGGLEFDEGTRAAAPRKKHLRRVEGQTPALENPALENRERQRQAAALRTEATRLAAAAARLASVADKAQGHVDQLREQTTHLQSRLREAEREARRARQAADKAGVDATRAQQRADAAPSGAAVDPQ